MTSTATDSPDLAVGAWIEGAVNVLYGTADGLSSEPLRKVAGTRHDGTWRLTIR